MNFFFVTFLLLSIPLFVIEGGKSQNGGGSDAGSPSSRSPAREGGGTSSRKRLLRWTSHAFAGRKSDSSAARDLVGDSGHKSLQSTMSLDPRAEWRDDEDVMKMMKQKYRKQLENKGHLEIITKAGSKPLVHYFLDKAEANDMDNEESVPFFKDGKFLDISVDLEKMKRKSGLVKALAKSRMSREEENSRDPNTERWNRPGRVESLREVEAKKQVQKLLEESQKNHLGMAGGGGKEEEEEERKGKKPVEIVDQQRSSQLLTKFADQTDDGAKESPGKSQKEAEASMGKRPKKEMSFEGQKSPGKTESSDVGEPAEEVGEGGEVFELGSINEEIASRRSSQQEEEKAVADEHQHKLAKENAMRKPALELGEYSTHLINNGSDLTESTRARQSPKHEHAIGEKTVKSDDPLEPFVEEPKFHRRQTGGGGQLAEPAEHVDDNGEKSKKENKRKMEEAGKEEKARHPINRHPINAAGSLGMAEEKASEQSAIEEVGGEENPIANSMVNSPKRKPPAVEQSHFHVGNENMMSKKKTEEEEEELIKAKSLAHPHQLAKAQHKTLHIGEQTPFEVQGNETGDENVATVPLAQSPKREPSMVEGVNAVADLAAPSPRGRPSAVEENLGVAGHNNEEIDGKQKAEEVKEREEVKPGNQEGHRHLLVDERRAENVGNSATDSEAHHLKGKPGANTHSLLMRFPAEREKPSRDGLPIVLPIPSPALEDANEFEEVKAKQMKVGEPKEVSEKKTEDAKAVKELIARFNHPNLEKSPPKQPLLPASRSFVMLRSEQPIRRAGGSFDGLYGSSGEKDKIRRGCKITRAIENPGRGGGTRRTLGTKPTSTAGDHQELGENDEANRKVVGEDN